MPQIKQEEGRSPLVPEEVFGSLVATESSYLPVRFGADGGILIDWRTAHLLPATPQAVAEIARELIDQATENDDQIKRILAGTRFMLDSLTEGKDSVDEHTGLSLTPFTSLDVANMLELFRERNPSTGSLTKLLEEGVSVDGIEIIYSASEQLRLSHAEVRTLLKYNIDISDPDDLGLIDDAIDVVLRKNKIDAKFRGIGLKLLAEALESGKFLSDILDETFES